MNMQLKSLSSSQKRSGVTIVEVLTSIIVAVIGVAGVLVLIPFGIRQAQFGLDLEDATNIGENAAAKFQILGYNNIGQYGGEQVLPWVIPDQNNPDITSGMTNLDGMILADDPLVKMESDAGFYFIDPLWVNSTTTPLPTPDMFSFVGESRSQQLVSQMVAFDQITFENGQAATPTIPAFLPQFVSVVDPTNPFQPEDTSTIPVTPSLPRAISQPLAVRTFFNNDDLQYSVNLDQDGNELGELAAPQPYLDRDSVGLDLRRQFIGEISWSAVAVPKNAPNDDLGDLVEGFDFFVMVYKNRSFLNPTGYSGPAESDPRFLYTLLDSSADDSPVGPNPVAIQGQGSIFLNSDVDIRNGEWIMLVNYKLDSVSETLQEAQVGFFRVIGNAADRILINGPNFEIQTLEDDGGGTLVPTRTATYAIYLRNVVGVYKRQLRLTSETQ